MLYNIAMYYVYILKNHTKQSLYIGYTKDLRRRLAEHKEKYNVELVYYEAYSIDKEARVREKKPKCYGSAWRGLKKRIRLA